MSDLPFLGSDDELLLRGAALGAKFRQLYLDHTHLEITSSTIDTTSGHSYKEKQEYSSAYFEHKVPSHE